MFTSWRFSVISIELRKQLQYRTQFLVLFLATVLAHMTVAYSFWGSIFISSGRSEIEGFTLSSMMIYYLAANLLSEAIRPSFSLVSSEILDGSLSKYLLYPVSFTHYKFFAYLGHVLFGLMKIFLCGMIFFALFGEPDGFNWYNLLTAVPSFCIATIIFFLLSLHLQLIGFWAEQVWALHYILIFIIDIVGGSMLPLATFPDSLQTIFRFLPFAYTIAFPVEVFIGRVTDRGWIFGTLISLAWVGILIVTGHLLWRRGLRRYTGVGI